MSAVLRPLARVPERPACLFPVESGPLMAPKVLWSLCAWVRGGKVPPRGIRGLVFIVCRQGKVQSGFQTENCAKTAKMRGLEGLRLAVYTPGYIVFDTIGHTANGDQSSVEVVTDSKFVVLAPLSVLP
jgi:hypothetical protein